jgi:hypothetical protein
VLTNTHFLWEQTVAVNDKLAANTITAVRFPQGVTGPALLPKIKAHGAELAGTPLTASIS